MHPVEEYLRSLREIRGSGGGVAETSYYGSLESLLNQAGRLLVPRVRCVINVRNQGAGLPDGGFFTRDQLRDDPADLLLKGQIPGRGVMEVKGTSDDVQATAMSPQVKDRYWSKYGQVLVTNLRSFLLVASDATGAFTVLERFDLAANEAEFWHKAHKAHDTAEDLGDQLIEFLARVLMRPSPLRDPADLAWYLASYAREANSRVAKADGSSLADVRSALEEALGIAFEGARGAHFFRSTLVQTLFYGVFSAWVLWAKDAKTKPGDQFDWRLTPWSLHVPMVAALYQQLSAPARLGALGVVQLLEWTGDTLNRVDRPEFFKRFDEGKAVQYFYEPFLKAYDPELRKELGVWYTPHEIVAYMVERVDTVLRSYLGIEDGLADPRVIVLDPCTGTGSFLVEVLRRIEQTLRSKGGDALVPNDLKQAARDRIIGFELLPAPFVIAHLQLGLLLRSLGAPLANGERAGVYLTNSLTGWSPGSDSAPHGFFPELYDEHDLAAEVKQEKRVIVVLGNPPYNAYAGVSPKEEGSLVSPYKEGLRSKWGIKKFNLDDLYIRFFRLAERRIAEQSGEGIVAYISNFSYLDEPSYVVMRERLLSEFDNFWFDSLNGDSRRTGKRTPTGGPDPSIFSTKANPAGIRVGTAIGIFAKTSGDPSRSPGAQPSPTVRFRQFWGTTKREDLVESLSSAYLDKDYELVRPAPENRYSFAPSASDAEYTQWAFVTDLAIEQYQGLSEDRRKGLIDIDRPSLEARMARYFDPAVSWEELRVDGGPLVEDYPGYAAKKVREDLLRTHSYDPSSLRPYLTRPFDLQWCYYVAQQPLWRRPRPEFGRQAWDGNSFLLTRFNASGPGDGTVVSHASSLADYNALLQRAVAIPRLLRDAPGTAAQMTAFATDQAKANLSGVARDYLSTIGLDGSAEEEKADLIWQHVLAVAMGPDYLQTFERLLADDYPRVPLPLDADVLRASAKLGALVAALLDVATPVPGVTTGAIAPHLQALGAFAFQGVGPLNPDKHLVLDAEWGYQDKANKVMPGPGRMAERDYAPTEIAVLEARACELGLTPEALYKVLGAKTVDVYLNSDAYWSNVPANVWRFAVTKNRVLKKWLSYRESSILGRALTPDEVRLFSASVRRITALLLLSGDLNENLYRVLSVGTYRSTAPNPKA